MLLLQATVGVADPAQRFSPVPEPSGSTDPCRDLGPVGRWVKMSATAAPASIHNQSWLDSAAVWTGTRLVVALRKDGKWNGTAFDPCANAWSPIPETREPPRAEPWLSEGHDRPFVPSHRNGSGSYDGFEQLSIWDAAGKAWVTVKTERPPAPRAHYAVALAAGKLLVWGGWAPPLAAMGDGAVLDLARKSWKKMSAGGAPSPRLEPTAVAWTGSRLLIWGGKAASKWPGPVTTLGDGAQYDPARDRWTPMSSVNAPSARMDATVAWTGRRLVVVGGVSEQSRGAALRDGGVYDPVADRWTPLEVPGVGGHGNVVLPKGNVGPLARVLVAADGRVVFLPEQLGEVVVLDAERGLWSRIDAGGPGPGPGTAGPGKRNSFRAFLFGRRLVVWGGLTVIAEHVCPPPVPGQPICDSFAETAGRDDGWMVVLPK
jgi:hypothetical protein